MVAESMIKMHYNILENQVEFEEELTEEQIQELMESYPF